MSKRGPGTGKLTHFQAAIRSEGFDALSRAAKAVLKDLWTIVCDNAPDSNGDYVTRAPNEYIGQWSGYNGRTVTRALAELERAGFLTPIGEGPARRITLQTWTSTTPNLDNHDRQPRHLRHQTRTSTTGNLDNGDTKPRQTRHASKEDKTNTRPETRPIQDQGDRASPPNQHEWLCVILPEGVAPTPADTEAAGKLAEYVRERYPSKLKPHHRTPANAILRAMAPSLVTMAESAGSIEAACEAARLAVDALAAHIAAHPDMAEFLPKLVKWLTGGGCEYEDPCEYLPHLKPRERPVSLPYGVAEAPDQSRVAEMVERIRTNRSGPTGQARRIAQ